MVKAHKKNRYPSQLIQRHLALGSQKQDNTEKLSDRVTLSYIQRMSEAIKRVLGELDIQTTFEPLVSLRNILSHPKDPLLQDFRSGIVYQILIGNCSKSYVRQTGRSLSQRIKEHRRAVENFHVDTSALAEHTI